jgi:hypothetical protein
MQARHAVAIAGGLALLAKTRPARLHANNATNGQSCPPWDDNWDARQWEGSD